MPPLTCHHIVAYHQRKGPKESTRHGRPPGDDEVVKEWSGNEEEERHSSNGSAAVSTDKDEEKDPEQYRCQQGRYPKCCCRYLLVTIIYHSVHQEYRALVYR